jgi:hypothetical protein
MIALVLVIGGAVGTGLVANKLFRQRVIADDEQGPGPEALLVPVTTFAALFIAFVLAQSTSAGDRHHRRDRLRLFSCAHPKSGPTVPRPAEDRADRNDVD